jgi:hypothetical protein
MNSKQRKTLSDIFANPLNGNLHWADIESLLLAAGAELAEGDGSRICFTIGSERVFFHRPHPEREALRYRVKDAREFLMRCGVTPIEEKKL